MGRKITKAEFRKTQEEFLRLVEAAGMGDWTIRFAHEHLDGCSAMCEANPKTNSAKITIATVLDDDQDQQYDPLANARHEFCHLFLTRLEELAHDRYVGVEQINDCCERMATHFERLLR